MEITIDSISKHYGNYQALRDINLHVNNGELVALLGPSGSGKTSLLRVIAGLEQADGGRVLFGKQDVTDTHVKSRHVGFVFQHYALFSKMTIFENVAYGLKVRPRKQRPAKKEIAERVRELLALVKLEPYEKRYPSQLSGGQRQRAALARALAVEPNILLLDEPFGALDAKVRKELRQWLRRLHDEFGMTSIFVTHDQEEALDVADRIVIMNEGAIEQIGTSQEVYDHPANPFVYDFLGSVNVFEGRVEEGKLITGNAAIPVGHADQDKGIAYVRPHHFTVEKKPSGLHSFEARAAHIRAIGPSVRLEAVRTDTGQHLEIELSKEQYDALGAGVGDTVYVKAKEVKVFAKKTYPKIV
ncbi:MULTISPECIES: sulfate/molybdate ABC transporter ATP-binding protein [Bacillus]|uniref:sulfate/molybdate ABC transporter ATP-binding protein n=1 Tax=Bacillus TaxID=1386 RepID=UPI002452F734|nr:MULTISPECIES: TOBE-like domain-containing protein [Bacillus]MDH3080145.1 TOBE-like domain-containing protein [Bacillus amyloliquefaciens]MDU0077432.1 TOBE-like domain-containing protein [Bacillus sp. IG2]MDU0102764.1 TOBE-like domain-containing protein [Bacillus sp. IS1]MEC2270348.1 TOBE-like domain-containing protein [Bacillus velezensis]MED3679242.1 TOBE-like domain-containing protein [Bacillus velezensis]